MLVNGAVRKEFSEDQIIEIHTPGSCMRRTLIVCIAIMGLVTSCTRAGGIEVGASLDQTTLKVERAATAAPGDGVSIVTADWRDAGEIVECVSDTFVNSGTKLQLLPAKDFPSSLYRWDTVNIAQLQKLISETTANDEIFARKVRYVVVVGVTTDWATDDGLGSPCIFTCGKRTYEWAKVWDLRTGMKVAEAGAWAKGRQVAPAPFIFPIFPLWLDPATEKTACEALGYKLAEYFVSMHRGSQ